METLTSFSQTTLSSLDLLDSMDNELTPQPFLKMEDLHTASSPAALSMDLMQTSPAPVIVHSKPAKKRKSWGQELPEPKTTLPPRKRAKTEDEKEQRRIERIKRNRAAAHNSRERKRQETETLAVALARANAELDAYRSLHGPLPASVVLPEVTLQIDEVDTPTPSLSESHGTVDYDTCPISPATHPENYIKQEALESTLLNLTPAFNLDVKPAQTSLLPLDSTQHSAAMLCDLQCRSSGPSPDVTSLPAIWWTQLFLYLMTFQLQTCSQTILMAIWSLSPSRMERLMQASTRRSTSLSTTSSMTPLLLRSMAMAQRNAATPTPIPQSAISALQRQSAMKSSEEMTNDVVRRRHLMLQSQALDRHRRKDADGRDTEVADNADSS